MGIDEIRLPLEDLFQHSLCFVQFAFAHANETDLKCGRAVSWPELQGLEQIWKRVLVLVIAPAQESGIQVGVKIVWVDRQLRFKFRQRAFTIAGLEKHASQAGMR